MGAVRTSTRCSATTSALKGVGSFLDETLLHKPHCRFSHMRDARAQRVNEECAMLVLTQLAKQFFQKNVPVAGRDSAATLIGAPQS